MTDNEKRAHDLAIAYLPIAYDEQRKALIDQVVKAEDPPESVDVSIDIFKLYCDLYGASLDAFNAHFPGK
ncbi:MAG: hypothetical protein LUG44_05455 [Clostridiales bacterium]|nr:hypothetical protein [Clostridiales bacterium]